MSFNLGVNERNSLLIQCSLEINVATQIEPATVPSLKMFAICNPFPFPSTIMSLTAVDALSFI